METNNNANQVKNNIFVRIFSKIKAFFKKYTPTEQEFKKDIGKAIFKMAVLTTGVLAGLYVLYVLLVLLKIFFIVVVGLGILVLMFRGVSESSSQSKEGTGSSFSSKSDEKYYRSQENHYGEHGKYY